MDNAQIAEFARQARQQGLSDDVIKQVIVENGGTFDDIPAPETAVTEKQGTNPFLRSLGRGFGLGTRSVLQGVLNYPGTYISDFAGLPKPEYDSEKLNSEIVEGVASLLVPYGLALKGYSMLNKLGRPLTNAEETVKNVFKFMSTDPVAQAAAGAGAGGAAELARQNGSSPIGQFGASVAGSIGGAGAIGAGRAIKDATSGAVKAFYKNRTKEGQEALAAELFRQNAPNVEAQVVGGTLKDRTGGLVSPQNQRLIDMAAGDDAGLASMDSVLGGNKAAEALNKQVAEIQGKYQPIHSTIINQNNAIKDGTSAAVRKIADDAENTRMQLDEQNNFVQRTNKENEKQIIASLDDNINDTIRKGIRNQQLADSDEEIGRLINEAVSTKYASDRAGLDSLWNGVFDRTKGVSDGYNELKGRLNTIFSKWRQGSGFADPSLDKYQNWLYDKVTFSDTDNVLKSAHDLKSTIWDMTQGAAKGSKEQRLAAEMRNGIDDFIQQTIAQKYPNAVNEYNILRDMESNFHNLFGNETLSGIRGTQEVGKIPGMLFGGSGSGERITDLMNAIGNNKGVSDALGDRFLNDFLKSPDRIKFARDNQDMMRRFPDESAIIKRAVGDTNTRNDLSIAGTKDVADTNIAINEAHMRQKADVNRAKRDDTVKLEDYQKGINETASQFGDKYASVNPANARLFGGNYDPSKSAKMTNEASGRLSDLGLSSDQIGTLEKIANWNRRQEELQRLSGGKTRRYNDPENIFAKSMLDSLTTITGGKGWLIGRLMNDGGRVDDAVKVIVGQMLDDPRTARRIFEANPAKPKKPWFQPETIRQDVVTYPSKAILNSIIGDYFRYGLGGE